jgi:hypothetical protein
MNPVYRLRAAALRLLPVPAREGYDAPDRSDSRERYSRATRSPVLRRNRYAL